MHTDASEDQYAKYISLSAHLSMLLKIAYLNIRHVLDLHVIF